MRKVEDKIDNVLVMTFSGVVGDFSESQRGVSRETCTMVYVLVHDELSLARSSIIIGFVSQLSCKLHLAFVEV